MGISMINMAEKCGYARVMDKNGWKMWTGPVYGLVRLKNSKWVLLWISMTEKCEVDIFIDQYVWNTWTGP